MEDQGRRSFGTNWGPRLLLSLVLAIVMWGWVTASGDPERSKVFPNIPITIDGLDDQFVIVGDVNGIEVRVTGPRSSVDSLLSTDMEAHINLAEVDGPGTYQVNVSVPRPAETWSAKARPQSLSIIVELQATEAFDVTTRISGNLGANQQVESVNPSASEVAVTGPASLVERVDRVELPIDIANRTTDFASVFTPVAVDADGQTVAGVELRPSTISATVEITARGKRVAVIAQLQGEPEQGFEVVDRVVNPNTVLVDGPASVLEAMITVNANVVDVTGANDDVTQRVSITGLPEGVTILEPQSGQVDVVVQIRQRGVQQPLPSQQVMVINLGEGLTAEVSPSEVLVTVIGNQQDLEQLSSSSLIVQVDAQGLAPGTYQLPPRVILPANMEWTNVDPATVTVTITSGSVNASGATPPASPESSPEI